MNISPFLIQLSAACFSRFFAAEFANADQEMQVKNVLTLKMPENTFYSLQNLVLRNKALISQKLKQQNLVSSFSLPRVRYMAKYKLITIGVSPISILSFSMIGLYSTDISARERYFQSLSLVFSSFCFINNSRPP